MDPNNPDFSNHFSDLGDDFIANPRFQLFLQRLGNTSLQNSPQQTPHQTPFENTTYEPHSPLVNQGSNSHFDDEMEETVSDTPQYPPPPPRVSVNQNQSLTKSSRMWSIAEDEALIGLYLQFSEDAIVGTNQKAVVLCCYDEAGRATGSGYNEADRINNASNLFYISSKPTQHNFNCHHGWEMVKNDPKWRTKLRWALSREERFACGDVVEDDNSGSEKRCRTEDEGVVPVIGFSSGGLPRPDGVKKAKFRRNKGKGVAFEVSNISEKMQQNNASREIEAQMRLKKLDFDMERERRKQNKSSFTKNKSKFKREGSTMKCCKF
ncbi:uncharacterized protein LOC110739814 [Chenopodium quinoa]|uniref:uncharacterized protein LOC110739814 n=1 Tax=Chenopodium quinoa TaxID=63459 RepID=UPI000B783867|nr:uncharacterized protein LOC110739814 [Chenopodium quinoa]